MPDRSFRRFPPASLVSDPRPADGVQGPLAGSGSAGNDWLRDEWQPHWGDPCRTKSGLPARYLGGGWALGRYSIADIHLFRLYWRLANSLHPAPEMFPNLTAHYQRMMARPAVQRTIEIESAIGYELPA